MKDWFAAKVHCPYCNRGFNSWATIFSHLIHFHKLHPDFATEQMNKLEFVD